MGGDESHKVGLGTEGLAGFTSRPRETLGLGGLLYPPRDVSVFIKQTFTSVVRRSVVTCFGGVMM